VVVEGDKETDKVDEHVKRYSKQGLVPFSRSVTASSFSAWIASICRRRNSTRLSPI
jgi:hypothetical protein